MRKLIISSILLLSTLTISAQAYLVSTLKPTEANRQRISSVKADPNSDWGQDYGLRPGYIYNSNAGFELDGDAHGLTGGDNHGYVTYKLNTHCTSSQKPQHSQYQGRAPANPPVLRTFAFHVQ